MMQVKIMTILVEALVFTEKFVHLKFNAWNCGVQIFLIPVKW
jgi:hypothetical protein